MEKTTGFRDVLCAKPHTSGSVVDCLFKVKENIKSVDNIYVWVFDEVHNTCAGDE